MKNKISIIIPTLRPYNFSELIGNLEINTASDLDIVAVTDQTIIDCYKDYNILPINFILDTKQNGTTQAIQLGLEKCKYDWIITLSDDCALSPYALEFMIKELEKYDNQLVIGNFNVYDKSGFLPKLGYYGVQFSPFPIIHRKTIETLGVYYCTDFRAFYSDPFLGLKLHQFEGKIINVSNALIYHPYNPDQLHKSNKSKYWTHDENLFKEKCKHLGEFKGVEILSKQ